MALDYTPYAAGSSAGLQRRPAPTQPSLINTTVPSSAPASGSNGYLQTPASALPVNSPLTAVSAQSAFQLRNGIGPVMSPMAFRTPTSAVSSYNPQEWQRSRPVPGAYVPHAPVASSQRTAVAQDATGMEASMPSPPPPYSPSPTQSIAQSANASPQVPSGRFGAPHSSSPANISFDYGHSTSNSTSAAHHDSSSLASPTFPPPPGMRDRSTSRSRGKFSLSAFRQKAADPSSSISAMDSLQNYTVEALARIPRQTDTPSPGPPASRRSASANAAYINAVPIQDAAGHAVHIPPPPPGPPPGSRSHSRDRSPPRSTSTPTADTSLAAPPTRRPTTHRSSLGSIPPTPADWIDDAAERQLYSSQPAQDQGTGSNTPERRSNSTDNANGLVGDSAWPGLPASPRPTSASAMAPSGLARLPAKRELSSKGIRERRNESRAGKAHSAETEVQGGSEPGSSPWAKDFTSTMPADLVLPPSTSPLSRHRNVGKATAIPRYEQDRYSDGIQSPELSQRRKASDPEAQRPLNLETRNLEGLASPSVFVPTPPFSPDAERSRPLSISKPTGSVSKPLPTPPHNRQNNLEPSSITPTKNDRTVSIQPAQAQNSIFAQDSLKRYAIFAEREASATSDREKLEIFAAFMVNESRIRRDRYAKAFDGMGSNVLDLTRDMWRPLASESRTEGVAFDPTRSTATSATTSNFRPDGNQSYTAGSTPTSATMMSESEIESPGNPPRTKSPWTSTAYQPCLSPIPSMAMSTIPDGSGGSKADDNGSRGRPASRWWEGSADGGSMADGARKFQRSKRESKYMGLPKEAREHLQWDEVQASPSNADRTPGPSQDFYSLGPNEYPTEKPNGVRPENLVPPPPPPPPLPPSTHGDQLDVSRLITLPPPYPRHHPALSNSHPDLMTMRGTLRAISDLQNVQDAKAAYTNKFSAASKAQELLSSSISGRRNLRAKIQEKVASGDMSFADAAKEEASFEADTVQKSRDAATAEFDAFRETVVSPLDASLSEKITVASASIDQLRSSLSHDAQNHDPTQTQEEGDEQPELLEKLTILKWLFEAREQLHKELAELHVHADKLYAQSILIPYMIANNQEKVREVEEFFTKDGQKNKVAKEKDCFRRFEELLKIVDANVSRGVEIQLSAFWDIAPALNTIVTTVPANLQTLNVLIPPQEYQETPSYYQFPTQYLYSLLEHAGKSTYQFIESQTNLLCLLHEVKSGVAAASCKLMETQRYMQGESFAAVEEEMKAIKADEDARLTADLKDKVGLVEDQWQQALGKGLEESKHRIRQDLVERGGWDESLQE